MMKTILSIATVALLSSCGIRVSQIGRFNMVANRNIETSVKYNAMKTYTGATKKELKKSRAETLEQAVDNVVRTVQGGEYLMNVKIYNVHHRGNGKDFYAVEGDVWGVEQQKSSK